MCILYNHAAAMIKYWVLMSLQQLHYLQRTFSCILSEKYIASSYSYFKLLVATATSYSYYNSYRFDPIIAIRKYVAMPGTA